MVTQPEALRLATKMDGMLGWDCCKEAAAELRRLHEVNQELLKALKGLLLDAEPCDCRPDTDLWCPVINAKALMKKATGENK